MDIYDETAREIRDLSMIQTMWTPEPIAAILRERFPEPPAKTFPSMAIREAIERGKTQGKPPATQDAIGEDSPGFEQTTDASKWARAFCHRFGGDEGLMIGWFANAIERGRADSRHHPPATQDAREFAVELSEIKQGTSGVTGAWWIGYAATLIAERDAKLLNEVAERAVAWWNQLHSDHPTLNEKGLRAVITGKEE